MYKVKNHRTHNNNLYHSLSFEKNTVILHQMQFVRKQIVQLVQFRI